MAVIKFDREDYRQAELIMRLSAASDGISSGSSKVKYRDRVELSFGNEALASHDRLLKVCLFCHRSVTQLISGGLRQGPGRIPRASQVHVRTTENSFDSWPG